MSACETVRRQIRKSRPLDGLNEKINAAARQLVERAQAANAKIDLHDPALPWRVQPSPYLQALFRGGI